ncbi:hypothetical protein [Streptomyces sp. NPDC096339]|uniref:hypothetical protein n=1 Tax=Streptomyces sp. NPDC096339 TaxID=3366086 RepID=UPI00382190F1
MSTLRLEFVLPHPNAIEQWAEVRALIDGRNLVEEIHPEGTWSCSRRNWFGPAEKWPLAAAEEARRVELSNNDCVTDCCGGVFVTIRRAGDRVVWTGWENTDDNRVPVPADVWFDATQYDAELVRAVADVSWERPVDTLARLLTEELAKSGCLERWGCVVLGIAPGRGGPARVEVHFRRVRDAESHWDAYIHDVPVTGHGTVREQLRWFMDLLTDRHPCETARRL